MLISGVGLAGMPDPCYKLVVAREWKWIMKTCWERHPADRSTMRELVQRITLTDKTLGLALPQDAVCRCVIHYLGSPD